mgnify:CR=1 FL=1
MSSKRRGIMSEALKYEIAQELGIFQGTGAGDARYEFANELGAFGSGQPIDWGSVSSRDCGNMVKMAIQMAQRNYANQ